MLDLASDQLTLIQESLQRQVPGKHVIAFGSRVSGKPRKYSDLDLCIMGEEPTEYWALSRLKLELQEGPLSISVDVLDWATLSENFRKIIASQPQEIIQAGDQNLS